MVVIVLITKVHQNIQFFFMFALRTLHKLDTHYINLKIKNISVNSIFKLKSLLLFIQSLKWLNTYKIYYMKNPINNLIFNIYIITHNMVNLCKYYRWARDRHKNAKY